MSKIQADTHIHMGCRTLDPASKFHWEPIALKLFKPSKNKAIFVFGGNTTNCDEAANGNAKVVEALLTEENRINTDIFSFVYEGEPISSYTKLLLKEYEEETHKIFETVFKPMLFDRDGNIKEKQGIEKVLKSIVFVSHCGGSNFVNIIIDDIYDILTEKYHPSIAKMLISKLQYFSYTPNVLPNKNVSSFIITPYLDNNYSWKKVLEAIIDEKIYTDSPKASTKSLLKTQEQGSNIYDTFENIFKLQRIIAFRSDQSLYLIPNRINSNTVVGDHSIDCLVKKRVLEANTDFAETARLLNQISKYILNEILTNTSFDQKVIFDTISGLLEKHKPNKKENIDETILVPDFSC